jgi:hypothetical protein
VASAVYARLSWIAAVMWSSFPSIKMLRIANTRSTKGALAMWSSASWVSIRMFLRTADSGSFAADKFSSSLIFAISVCSSASVIVSRAPLPLACAWSLELVTS